MHAPVLRAQALDLVAEGLNDCEVSRRLGVPRTTVREWRAPRVAPRPATTCPRCWRAAKPMRFSAGDYCLLLGLYLGDGCISRTARTSRLRIHLDTKYPGIIAETGALLRRCFPDSSVSSLVKDGGSCAVLSVCSNHLPCLFPQHGPGKKHQRSLALEGWQAARVSEAPWSLLRGLIWSDGCSFVNRHGRYTDLCFAFSNSSTDLLDLFCASCDAVGVTYRRYDPRAEDGRVRPGSVRVNRRPAVALMRENLGVKH